MHKQENGNKNGRRQKKWSTRNLISDKEDNSTSTKWMEGWIDFSVIKAKVGSFQQHWL